MRLPLVFCLLCITVSAHAQHPNKPIKREPLLSEHPSKGVANFPNVKPMLFSPQYTLSGEGSHNYGWSFMVYHPDSLFPILLTAHHHFTRRAGLQRNIGASALPDKLKSFEARASNNATMIINSGNVLQLPKAQSISRENYNNDLAAILLFKNYPEYGAQLRTTKPEVGERFWLHAAIVHGNSQPWFPGTVTFSDDTGMEMEMDSPDLVLKSVSGSPILDQDGMVVGMLLDSTKTQEGKLYIMAISGDQINRHISAALKRQ